MSDIALTVRAVRIVQDSTNRSPEGRPTDIVELDLAIGGVAWSQPVDCYRFRCERGMGDRLAAAFGPVVV